MTKKLRVAFRADASQVMGTGHVRRCMALAQALEKFNATTVFVCRRHDAVSAHVLPLNYPCHWLTGAPAQEYLVEAPEAFKSVKAVDALDASNEGTSPYATWGLVPWQQDADQTVAALQSAPPDWLVIDHYTWDARWHQHVIKTLGCKLMVIDDLADRQLDADLLLNQNIHSDHAALYEKLLGGRRSKSQALFGPRFALLSGRYATAPRYVFSPTVRSIGIFMGGTDPEDLSSQALLACREVAQFKGDVVLVSSSVSPHHAQRQALAATWPQTQVLTDLPDLTQFFSQHDLQVGSGGGAAWERCCIGAPTLACSLAVNQDAVLLQLADAGALELVDILAAVALSHVMGEKVRSLIQDSVLRQTLSSQASSWVDGQGSSRVAASMVLAVRAELGLRRAALADEQLLLGWSNDRQTRLNAFDSDVIQKQAHAIWLRSKLNQLEDCVFLVAEAQNGIPVGTIRFDHRSDDVKSCKKVWWVSYSIDSAFRGLGLGRLLVELGANFMEQSCLGVATLKALVKFDNHASAKIFASLGFSQTRAEHAGQTVYCFQKPLGLA